MGSHSGFTPVRRRDAPQQDISPVTSAQVPWTAKRCLRLLRPLSSKIAMLHKQKQASLEQYNIAPPDNSSRSRDHSCRIAGVPLSLFNTYQGNSEAIEKCDDPDWSPENRPRKRPRRTYSSKALSQNPKKAFINTSMLKSRPAEAKIQIPLGRLQDHSHNPSILRTAIANEHSHVLQEVSCRDGECASAKDVSAERNCHISTSESFRKISKSVSPSEWALGKGLYDGLDALLKATTRSKGLASVGALSLFATCIRKVPEHMVKEQKIAKAEDPDYDGDVSSLIYEDLESYGSSETGGWRPLREVTRAHGINYLGNAIKDGTVKPTVARGLVVICLRACAFDEAQQLIESSIRVMQPFTRPRWLSEPLFSFQSRMCLFSLNEFSHKSGRHSFLYRQLASLFSTETVSVEFIASDDMVECWNQVIGHIVQDDTHAKDAELLLRTAVAVAHSGSYISINDEIHAYRLCVHSIPKPGIDKARSGFSLLPPSRSSTYVVESTTLKACCGTAVTNTLTDLLTVLLSISLVSDASCSKGVTVRSLGPNVLQSLALEANHCYQMSRCSTDEDVDVYDRTTRLSVPIFAYGIFDMMTKTHEAGNAQLDMGWLEILKNLDEQASTVSRLSTFLCALAHCCDQAGAVEGFESLRKVLGHLLDLSKSRGQSTAARRFIRRVAIDAAFEFAEGTKKRKHLDWVLELEDSLEGDPSRCAIQTPGRTPAKASLLPATGFRWEDGICEWVARTPAVVVTKLPKDEDLAKIKIYSDDEPMIVPERETAVDGHVWLQSPSTDERRGGRATKGMRRRPRGRPRKASILRTTDAAIQASSGRVRPNPVRVLQGLDDDADGLCASESSQEAVPAPAPVLRELRNGSADDRLGGRRSTGRYETKSGSRRSWPGQRRRRWSWSGVQDSESERERESDDELGT